MTTDTPQVLGWREWVGFPDIGIPKVKAKVDTGATAGGSNSILQKWKQKEQDAIEKAKRPGRE